MRFLKFMFIGMMLGLVTGVGVAFSSTLLSPWEFAGRVPGTPAKIMYPYPTYVQTTDEQVYFCTPNYPDSCVPAKYEPFSFGSYSDLCAARGAPDSQTPLYPGRMIASASSRICGSETSIDDYAIALDDGSVWTWRTYGMRSLAEILSGAFGAFLGTVIGIVLHSFTRPTPEKIKRS